MRDALYASKIVAYAQGNRALARQRAQAVAQFLMSHVSLKVRYVLVTRLRLHLVKVQTISQ